MLTFGDVLPQRPRDRDRVDAGMRPEAAILCRDRGRDQHRRQARRVEAARCACRRPTATRRAAHRDGRQRQSTSCRRGRGAPGRSVRGGARARRRAPLRRQLPANANGNESRDAILRVSSSTLSAFIDALGNSCRVYVSIYQCSRGPTPARFARRLCAALRPQALPHPKAGTNQPQPGSALLFPSLSLSPVS